MILTLFRRSEAAPAERPGEELWSVRVGRSEGEGATTDLVPSSLLAPEIDVAQPYHFEEFRERAERLTLALQDTNAEPATWTTLPLRVRWAQGELEEPMALRARQAAEMAVRNFVSFVQEAFPTTADLWVRVE